MKKVLKVIGILAVAVVLLPVFKSILDSLYTDSVAPLEGLTIPESTLMNSWYIILLVVVVVAIFNVIKSKDKEDRED